MYKQITLELDQLADKTKAEFFPRFFKSDSGGYAEGDKFIGVTVPNQRKVAKKYINITLPELTKLLTSEIHEYRLTAVFILVNKYEKTKNKSERADFVKYYLEHIDHINNWDIVDSSAHKILGRYYFENDLEPIILYELAETKHLWKQRIAIIATYYYIKQRVYIHTFKIADILLEHKHDLIHKAVGWMLREVGNMDQQSEIDFLKTRYNKMPRTMLRYAIEKFPENLRLKFLKGTY